MHVLPDSYHTVCSDWWRAWSYSELTTWSSEAKNQSYSIASRDECFDCFTHTFNLAAIKSMWSPQFVWDLVVISEQLLTKYRWSFEVILRNHTNNVREKEDVRVGKPKGKKASDHGCQELKGKNMYGNEKERERQRWERENEPDCPSEDSWAFRTAETCTSTLLILLQG